MGSVSTAVGGKEVINRPLLIAWFNLIELKCHRYEVISNFRCRHCDSNFNYVKTELTPHLPLRRGLIHIAAYCLMLFLQITSIW